MAEEMSGVGLAWLPQRVGCLTWLSVDLMFSEKVPFCYNMAPDDKPTASSGAPLSQQ